MTKCRCTVCGEKGHTRRNCPQRKQIKELNRKEYNIEYQKNHPNIPLRIETKEMLDNIGKKGESYDDVVQKLLKFWGSKL